VQGDGVPRWLSPQRAESERFARAVEDPETAGDGFADELALLGSLRDLGETGSPDEEARRRIRADIVGRFSTVAALAAREAKKADERRARPMFRGRLVAAAAAAAAVLVALGGLSLVLSKDALPGDPLYAVKRAGESATLGLTFGQQAKAEKHLEFAGNRLNELARLRDSGGGSDDYLTGLADFESDARAGVAQLTELAAQNGSAAQLTRLTTWARERGAELATESTTIPSAVAGRFNDVQSLLAAIQTRVTDLTGRMDCYRITSGFSDDLGALPAQGDCERRPAPHPTPSTSPAPPTGSPAPPTTAKATVSATSEVPTPVTATPPLPRETAGVTPPPVAGPPIPPTTGPRLPTTTATRPPLVSRHGTN
jgi:hypothetical protein